MSAWEVVAVTALVLLGALAVVLYLTMLSEMITRAVVRGYLQERFNVNRQLYGKISETEDGGKQA